MGGGCDWLAVSNIMPQAPGSKAGVLPDMGGAGIESYSDASSRQVFLFKRYDWLIFYPPTICIYSAIYVR
jgi:hypothetical protein